MRAVHSECTLSLHTQSLLKRFFYLGDQGISTIEEEEQFQKSDELCVVSKFKICSNSLAQVILEG